jgi:hypothetical protein
MSPPPESGAFPPIYTVNRLSSSGERGKESGEGTITKASPKVVFGPIVRTLLLCFYLNPKEGKYEEMAQGSPLTCFCFISKFLTFFFINS